MGKLLAGFVLGCVLASASWVHAASSDAQAITSSIDKLTRELREVRRVMEQRK